MQTLHYFNIG